MNRVAIIGAGLIGGSFGLALKRHKLAAHITGAGHTESTRRAAELGAIDEACDSVEAAVAGADLVFLATPVLAILDLLERVRAVAPPHALVTDGGSTKERIVEMGAKVFGESGSQFIGGHPMAGKEQRGV